MMKKLPIIMVVSMLMIFSTQAYAGFGIKAGLSSSNWYGEDYEDTDELTDRVAPCGGFFISIPIAGLVTVQPELLYMMKGWGVSGDLFGMPVELDVKVDYIEVPVLAKFNIFNALAVKPVVYAGPYLGFNTSSKVKGTLGSYSAEAEFEDVFGKINDSDAGFVIGAGIDFNFALKTVTIDARYTHGLSKVYEPFAGGEDAAMKNRTFAVMAGITF